MRLATVLRRVAKHVGCCWLKFEAPAKRSQHFNATYRNIVGRNMLRAFGHRVAMCCDVLGVVGSNLTIFKPEPTTPNMSQHIATRWPNARNMHVAPNNVAICCVEMLRSFGRGLKLVKFEPTTPNTDVATRWPNARNMLRPAMLRHVVLACCDRLAGA